MTVDVGLVVVLLLGLVVLGLVVLQMFGAGHPTEGSDDVFDLCCFVIAGVCASLKLIREVSAQPRPVGNFLGGQPGEHACDRNFLGRKPRTSVRG